MNENESESEGRRPGRNPDTIQVALRLDRELHARLRELAAADERSLHGYIVRVLREHAGRQAGRP